MKKKSGQIFIRGLIKSFFSVCALVLIFFVSYKLTGVYLEKNGNKDSSDKISMQREGRIDSVAFNLIFSLNETSKELEHVVLETLNTKTDCLVYTTIPMNTRLAMSHELYQEFCENNSDVPQILSFNAFKDYVKPSEYYDFGANLVDDALGIDISYYTIVPSDVFDDIFVGKKDHLELSEKVKKTVSDFDENGIISYLKDFYKSTKSNLSLEQRLTYTPALSKVIWEDVIFHVIPGQSGSMGYVIDTEKSTAIWDAMKNNYVAEEIKGLVGLAEKVSLDKNIIIYNGSGINGLASSVQGKLEAEGYTISQIGNYTSSDVQNTIIQVKEEGLGNDLIPYFKTATVEINESMPAGVDIQIVLGKSESAS